jgi:hypothetical protein
MTTQETDSRSTDSGNLDLVSGDKEGGTMRDVIHQIGHRPGIRFAAVGALTMFGVALLASPRVAEARPWKVKNVQATICADGKPFFGTPANAKGARKLWCKALSTTVSGAVAYNGKQAWGRWIDCPRSTNVVLNKVTWCQYWNNGASAPEKYMDLGVNGEVKASPNLSLGVEYGPLRAAVESQLHHIHSYWLRVDVTPKGKVKLRGGLYTG